MKNPLRAKLPFGGHPVINFADELDRRKFLRAAAVVGVGSTLAYRTVNDPVLRAQDVSQSDLEILNYALTLEYLESDFYAQGLAANILEGRTLELVEPIGSHEAAHVTAITDTINQLGGTPTAKPTFTYPEGTFTDPMTFLTTATTFEETGVKAYQGQVTNIQSPDILAAAASIAGVESRHAAILEDLTGGNPFPAPVEPQATMEEILAIVMPFIQGGS